MLFLHLDVIDEDLALFGADAGHCLSEVLLNRVLFGELVAVKQAQLSWEVIKSDTLEGFVMEVSDIYVLQGFNTAEE